MALRRLAVLKTSIAGGLSVLAMASAHASGDPIEVEISGEASAVAGISDNDAAGDADAFLEVKGSTVLENGIELGAVVEGRLDGQQPDRLYAGGRYSSLLIGGARGVGPIGGDAYLQAAYGYARGGFGQVILGRDHGVGRTFAVKAPTIFRAININDWRTDLSGLNDIHTVNDFSGNATKITYLPPANVFGSVVGGLQLGVSYSPSLGNCGDNLCAPEGGFVVTPEGLMLTDASEWDDVVEAGLYYQKGIEVGQSSTDRLLLGVGASYVTADENARTLASIYGDYEAYSLGINLGYRGLTVGGSVKTTNAGLDQLDDDGYLAFDAGITFKTGEDKGDWGFMLGYGQSEASIIGQNPLDPIIYRDTQTAQAGVTYFVGRGISVGAAAQFVESTKPDEVGGPEEAATLVVESSIKF